MNPIEQVAFAWQSLIHAIGQMLRPAVWTPWLALGAIQVGVLVALCFAAHPWLSPLLAPIVTRLAGERALHYPDLFLALAGLYARFDLVIAALPGTIVLGASTALFRDVFLGQRPDPAAAGRGALRRAATLVLVNLPFHLLAAGWSALIGMTIGARGGIIGIAAYVLALAGSVVLQSLFLYVSALVIIDGRGVLGTMRALPHTLRRGFWAALVLGILLLLPLLPMNLLSGSAGLIASRGRPELLALLTLAQLLIALIAGFLLSGATTLVFLGGIARRGEEAPR